MKNNFEENIEQAMQEIARGKTLEEAILIFSADEQKEARELLKTATMLSDLHITVNPNEESFRIFLSRIPHVVWEPKKILFTKVPWRIGASITFAFAACMLLVVSIVQFGLFHGGQESKEKNEPTTVAGRIIEEIPEINALSTPMPQPDANVDNAVSALLSDMNQESTVLNAEASTVKTTVDKTNVLPQSYDASQI